MPSFALIAEGLTDQLIIERILEEFYDERLDEVIVNPVQPLRDRTHAHLAPHGGWEKVFEFCEQSVEDALATNDYVVIHIDTDCGDHENFGLPLTVGGVAREYDVLVDEARAILISKIGQEIYSPKPERFIFAVAVHSVECWVLLILFDDTSLLSCFRRLHHQLAKNGIKLAKDYATYSDIVRPIRAKRLRKLMGSANSLGRFLLDLEGLDIGA